MTAKVAVVTGASRNTGRAIALRLAQAGWDVGVMARQDLAAATEVADEVRALERRAVPVLADVSSADEVHAGVAHIREVLGPVTGLVCAAAYRSHTAFRELTAQEWRRALAVDLDGVFHCVQAVLDDMIQAQFGRIVAITGTSAHRWPTPVGDAHVAAAKAGVEGMVRALAREFAASGVTANAVAPGPIETVKSGGTSRQRFHYRVATGRRAQVDEVAGAVAMLLGQDAGWVNGNVVVADGGGPVYEDERITP